MDSDRQSLWIVAAVAIVAIVAMVIFVSNGASQGSQAASAGNIGGAAFKAYGCGRDAVYVPDGNGGNTAITGDGFKTTCPAQYAKLHQS